MGLRTPKMFDLKTGDGKPAYTVIEEGIIRSPYSGKWYDHNEVYDRNPRSWSADWLPIINGKQIKLSGRYANEASCIAFWKKQLIDRPEPYALFLSLGYFTVVRLKPL